jgi:hypothetical protein
MGPTAGHLMAEHAAARLSKARMLASCAVTCLDGARERPLQCIVNNVISSYTAALLRRSHHVK